MNKITFPFKGINNNNSYETQPLGTCASAQNVRGYDAIKGRLRGGQRPGLTKFVDTEINGGATIHDLNYIKAVVPKTDGLSAYVLSSGTNKIYKILIADGTPTELYDAGDQINTMVKDSAGNIYMGLLTPGGRTVVKIDSDGTEIWDYDTGAGVGGILYDWHRNRIVAFTNVSAGIVVLNATTGSLLWETAVPLDSGNPQTIKMDSSGNYYVCSRGRVWDGLRRSFWKLNPDDGSIIWAFSFDDAAENCYDVDIDSDDNILIVAGDSIATWGISAPLVGPAANIWKLDTDGTVLWNDLVLNGVQDNIRSCSWAYDGDIYVGLKGTAGDDQAFQKIKEDDRSVIWDYSINTTAIHYVNNIYEEVTGTYVYLVGTRGGSWENNDGTSKTTWKLPSDGAGALPLWAADTATTGHAIVAGIDGEASDSATVEVISIVSEGDIYRYRDGAIAAVTGGNGVLQSKLWGMSQPAYNNIFFVDGAAALYYDIDYTAANDAIKIWQATEGTMPSLCKLITLYRGRIVLSGTADDPHNWYMSKVGDPFDWDYSPATTSAIQAVAGNNSEVGLIGDSINGIAPWSDDLCIFGCDSSIYIMAGDPAAGGSIDLLTDKTGMTFGKAWCFDPNGVLYFHGLSGIYRLVPGGKPESITDNSIKRIMDSIDLSTYYVRLYWDINQQGLYMVFIAQNYSGIGGIYFWDQKQGAWWKDAYLTAGTGPLSFHAFDADAVDDRCFLLGCKDGYIRKIDNAAGTDDGHGITSEVILGPYIASPGKSLRLSETDITLGKTSGNLDFYVYSGDYAEDVIVSLNTRIKRSLKAGLNRRLTHRVKAPALKFKLQSPNTVVTQWALENLSISIKESGTVRGGRI